MKRFICAFLSLLMAVTLFPAVGVSAKAHVHRWTEWEIISQVDCENDGIKVRYCTECQATDCETAEAFGHNWTVDDSTDKFGWNIVLEPTCTNDGKEQRVCSDVVKRRQTLSTLWVIVGS